MPALSPACPEKSFAPSRKIRGIPINEIRTWGIDALAMWMAAFQSQGISFAPLPGRNSYNHAGELEKPGIFRLAAHSNKEI